MQKSNAVQIDAFKMTLNVELKPLMLKFLKACKNVIIATLIVNFQK